VLADGEVTVAGGSQGSTIVTVITFLAPAKTVPSGVLAWIVMACTPTRALVVVITFIVLVLTAVTSKAPASPVGELGIIA